MISRSFLVFFLVVAAVASSVVVTGFSPVPSVSTRTRPATFETTDRWKMSTKMDETTDNEAAATEKKEEAPPANDAKAKMTAMMRPIKEAGPAGALSLFLWEGAFWAMAIPVSAVLYFQTTGSWPNWGQKEDVAKVVGEAVVFANIARFALPIRVGLAVATTPWVKENIVDRFGLFQNKEQKEEA